MDSLIIKNKIANIIAFGVHPEIDLSQPTMNRLEGKLWHIIEYKRKLAKESKAILKELRRGFDIKFESNYDEKKDEGINYKIILSDEGCKELLNLKLINKTMLFGGKKLEVRSIQSNAAKSFIPALKELIIKTAKSQRSMKDINDSFNVNDFANKPAEKIIDELMEKYSTWNNTPERIISMQMYNILIKHPRIIPQINTDYFKTAVEIVKPRVVLNFCKIYYDFLERSIILDVNIKEVACDGYINYKVEDSMDINIYPKKPTKYIPLAETDMQDVKDLDIGKRITVADLHEKSYGIIESFSDYK